MSCVVLDFDNSYEMYKQAFVSLDSVAVGYLECTSEPGYYTEGTTNTELYNSMS